MSSPASRVVIIGAGIGGLTLALLLRRRGIIAEILEQVPEPRYSAASGFRGLVPIERLPRLPDPAALQFKALARAVRDVDEDGKGRRAAGTTPSFPARTMM
jgi:2-polyprenyl-6-methoxyphenol hydroxylase-like FAD-dependent oxidoreductase